MTACSYRFLWPKSVRLQFWSKSPFPKYAKRFDYIKSANWARRQNPKSNLTRRVLHLEGIIMIAKRASFSRIQLARGCKGLLVVEKDVNDESTSFCFAKLQSEMKLPRKRQGTHHLISCKVMPRMLPTEPSTPSQAIGKGTVIWDDQFFNLIRSIEINVREMPATSYLILRQLTTKFLQKCGAKAGSDSVFPF